MNLRVPLILLLLLSLSSEAQKQFHVFPETHKVTPGKATGNGSLEKPWDLQTALSQSPEVVNGDDTIWLHEGIYNGRYVSTLRSTLEGRHITVSSFENDKVVLNGNVKSNLRAVLQVKGRQVVFKDFEVTFLGSFPRSQKISGFKIVDGINHSSGENCKFINLVIHNNPGSGFGSWKLTADTEISYCLIFNNGYYSTKRGSGVGIYVQNASDKNRLIQHNIIFNNYYKGMEVWSDNRKATSNFVKNIVLKKNVIFNSALVTGEPRDNLIIATNDNGHKNIASNIKVLDNIFYHNTDFSKGQIDGESPSLTVGFNKNAPVEKVVIKGNTIIGRNDGIRILHAKGLILENNTVYAGYIRFAPTFYSNYSKQKWHFANNKYYTRKSKTIRIQSKEDFTLQQWLAKYGLDQGSQWKPLSDFNLDPVLDITQNHYKNSQFRLVLFDKKGNDVRVNFSKYHIAKGTYYTVRDVESHDKIIASGYLGSDGKIRVPMKLNKDNKNKSLDNFGVFIVEFSPNEAPK